MFEEVTGAVVNVLEVVMAPFTVFHPLLSLLLVTIFLSAIVMIINYFSVKRDLLKQIKTRMSEIRESLTQAQKAGNIEEANKFLAEMMKLNNEFMKHNFKAMVISLVVLVIFLPWIKVEFANLVANLPFTLPFFGSQLSWLYWYILASFTAGWVIRKMVEGE